MRSKKSSSKINSARQPRQQLNESFRRNNVVLSRSQKEIARNQQSVTQRQVERKRFEIKRRFKRRILAGLFILVLIFLAIRMNVTALSINTNASSKLNHDQQLLYESKLLNEYKKHTFIGQYWLFDEQSFKDSVKKDFPEIEDLTLNASVPFSTNLNASLKFRRAVFTWRDASGQLQFVDKNGVLFSKDLDASVDIKKLISIEDQSGTVLEPGNPVLTANLVKFVGQMHDKITPVYPGKKIAKVIIPRSTREIQLQVTDVSYTIKFSSERTLDEQITELKTLVNYLQSRNIQPSMYIDIRLAHKAFYK